MKTLIGVDNNSLVAALGTSVYVISLPAFEITRIIDVSKFVKNGSFIAQGVVAGQHGYFTASGRRLNDPVYLLKVDLSAGTPE